MLAGIWRSLYQKGRGVMPDMPDPDRLREAVNSFLVASSEKRSDQPDMPYVEIMGPSLDDVAFVLDAARFLLSVLDEGSRVVVEAPCEHGELEPHGWVCGEHDTDEKCPRRNCEAYLDFGDHCPQLHRKGDACWSASACGGGSRRQMFPNEGVVR